MIQPSKSVSSRCLIDWFNQFAFIPESSREIRGNLAKSVSIFSSKINTTLLIFHFDLLVYTDPRPYPVDCYIKTSPQPPSEPPGTILKSFSSSCKIKAQQDLCLDTSLFRVARTATI